MINFLLEIPRNIEAKNPSDYFRRCPDSSRTIAGENFTLILWGDPILSKDIESALYENTSVSYLTRNVCGHYYYLLHDRKKKEIILGNSLFGILPVYYRKDSSGIFVSNDPLKLIPGDKNHQFDKRFMLESVLFNYSLFDRSCLDGIDLMPSNHYLELRGGTVTLRCHLSIEDCFVENPEPWQKSAENIADIFISASRKYFCNEPHYAALTAGLDSRTLLCCGLYHKKKITAYNFGSIDSEDIRIASIISKKIGLEFNPFYLDEDYIKNQSLDCGLDFIRLAHGEASFSRAHYLYSARKLAEKTGCIVTGNFGSEILRAAHLPGVMVSPNLVKYFFSKNHESGLESIERSYEFCWLNKENFKKEWESLAEDLKELPRFNPKYKNLTLNQKFYVLVFNTIFRKYFGPEMSNQYQYLINRTPFLDFEFLNAILQTEMAAVYSDFFTSNPLKRYKGQILYSFIMQKTCPQLAREKTDKGYCPMDLLTLMGKLQASAAFVKRKIKRRGLFLGDEYSVRAAFNHNKSYFQNIPVKEELFNATAFKKSFDKGVYPQDSFFIALSQAWWQNELGCKK